MVGANSDNWEFFIYSLVNSKFKWPCFPKWWIFKEWSDWPSCPVYLDKQVTESKPIFLLSNVIGLLSVHDLVRTKVLGQWLYYLIRTWRGETSGDLPQKCSWYPFPMTLLITNVALTVLVAKSLFSRSSLSERPCAIPSTMQAHLVIFAQVVLTLLWYPQSLAGAVFMVTPMQASTDSTKILPLILSVGMTGDKNKMIAHKNWMHFYRCICLIEQLSAFWVLIISEHLKVLRNVYWLNTCKNSWES